MNRLLRVSLLTVLLYAVFVSSVSAEKLSTKEKSLNLNEFAQQYFKAWEATQAPEASEADIDNYLALLKPDVGHQHYPYDPEASRISDNRAEMKKGMSYYLGAHKEYKASLRSVVVGHNVVVINYATDSKGVHPQSGELLHQVYDTVEVLEIEDGKVAIIRKYSE